MFKSIIQRPKIKISLDLLENSHTSQFGDAEYELTLVFKDFISKT